MTDNVRNLNRQCDKVANSASGLWHVVMSIPLSPEGQNLALDLAHQISNFQCSLDSIRDLARHETNPLDPVEIIEPDGTIRKYLPTPIPGDSDYVSPDVK